MDIKAIREKLGLTQEQLAHKIGVSFPTVNRWERKKSKPSPMAQKLLERLARNAKMEDMR